jgi:hypothetical protein
VALDRVAARAHGDLERLLLATAPTGSAARTGPRPTTSLAPATALAPAASPVAAAAASLSTAPAHARIIAGDGRPGHAV